MGAYMRVKGIIDYDCTNYKEPCLTIQFPFCTFKCDALNGCKVCQNSQLANEPDIEVSGEFIWNLYEQNPLTKAFCFQGLEPFDSYLDLLSLVMFIRMHKKCDDPIIIYTGYNEGEDYVVENSLRHYNNIIIKYGRFIKGHTPHYDELLGVNLASDNQYAKVLI
jgi:hypothetical protein